MLRQGALALRDPCLHQHPAAQRRHGLLGSLLQWPGSRRIRIHAGKVNPCLPVGIIAPSNQMGFGEQAGRGVLWGLGRRACPWFCLQSWSAPSKLPVTWNSQCSAPAPALAEGAFGSAYPVWQGGQACGHGEESCRQPSWPQPPRRPLSRCLQSDTAAPRPGGGREWWFYLAMVVRR